MKQTPAKTTQVRREKGNERRRLVLAATCELLTEHSIETLTLAHIAEATAIPVSSLYHFYPKILNVYSDLMPIFSEELRSYLLENSDLEKSQGWQQLVDNGLEATAEFYRKNPAYQQLILSGRAPAQLKSADREGDTRLAQTILEMAQEKFELPKIPGLKEIFFNAVEVGDLFLSLDLMRNEKITQAGVEEAKRACKSYLRTYLPEILYENE